MHCNTPLTAKTDHDAAAEQWRNTPEPVRATLRELHTAVERERIARSHALAQRRTFSKSL